MTGLQQVAFPLVVAIFCEAVCEVSVSHYQRDLELLRCLDGGRVPCMAHCQNVLFVRL